MPSLRCGNCHAELPEGVHPYTMRIELFPRVEESTRISGADLEQDIDEEIRRAIAQLSAMTEEEQIRQEERVYSSFSFVLCARCRDWLAQQLKAHKT